MSRKSKRPEQIDDPLIAADLESETIGGATNAAAALGNGSLTVGVSPWSELVYFRWPATSHYDHLRYVTVSRGILLSRLFPGDFRWDRDAPCQDWRRYGRPHEKHRGLGARAGIGFDRGGVLWMDDPVWESSRHYTSEASPVLVTELRNNENNTARPVTVGARQFVMPSENLLVQRFEVRSPAARSFFYHATFAPWRQAETGISNRDSRKAGFAAAFCTGEALLLWFRPHRSDPRRLGHGWWEGLTPSGLDERFPEGGVFVALGSAQPLDQFQIGRYRPGNLGLAGPASGALCPASLKSGGPAGDVSSKCRLPGIGGRESPTGATGRPGGPPAGAREDAQDGRLEGNPVHVGRVDAGIRIDLARAGPEVEILISVADSARGAARLIAQARELGPRSLEDRACEHWEPIARKIFLPGRSSPGEKRVARRSVLNLLIGRDRSSGAFVASPSRQPRYCCDWPRDGAFFDLALDLAGFPELVAAHLEFYRRTQRRAALGFSPTWLVSLRSPFYRPRGHWFSNMRTDGSPGFMRVIPIEIDQTSLMVWDIWRHSAYVPAQRQDAYRDSCRGTVELATEALLRFVDLEQGWTRPVMEDDDPFAKATLHGASAALTGLASAAALGKQWRLAAGQVANWTAAARRLREVMLRRLADTRVLDAAGWRGLQWSLFPAPLFENASHPAAETILARLASDLEAKITGRRAGAGYLGEQLFSLAAITAGIPRYEDLKQRALRFLVEEAPVPGSDCYGEVGLWKTGLEQGRRFIQNRTSIPHLWSGITVYLAVVAVHEPDRLRPLRPPLP